MEDLTKRAGSGYYQDDRVAEVPGLTPWHLSVYHLHIELVDMRVSALRVFLIPSMRMLNRDTRDGIKCHTRFMYSREMGRDRMREKDIVEMKQLAALFSPVK